MQIRSQFEKEKTWLIVDGPGVNHPKNIEYYVLTRDFAPCDLAPVRSISRLVSKRLCNIRSILAERALEIKSHIDSIALAPTSYIR